MSDENTAPATAPAEQPVQQPSVISDASAAESAPQASVAAPANKAADSSELIVPVNAAKLPPKEGSDKPAEAPAKPLSEESALPADVERESGAEPYPAPAAEAAGELDHRDAQPANAAPSAAVEQGAPNEAPSAVEKSKARRKSATAATEHKGKKLNKKASKARILHLDAKPGDHFFVKLKGYPPWPAIICDEEMLPEKLLQSRPVTAARSDGTYRDDYADGGKRASDRTFPVMYLHTNEFGWVPNADLHDLDPEKVLDVKMDKMRKDLQAAHELAAQHHDLDFYKGVLQQFQEDLIEQQKAREAKAHTTPAKKGKKAKVDEDEDVEMADVADEEEDEDAKEKKSKKRKAEEDVNTPQRSDSVKKPKIKFTSNSTPKTANGASTPKSSKPQAEGKTTKSKPKKSSKDTEEKKSEKEATTPKEPELTPEEKHARKEKEVLFLRHKLQKGLLTRDQEPKEEEMKMMSDYVTKLEGFPDLEVSIIRATKINKVLKAILKLDTIPKEEEFQFKPRSQVLLDKWNKLLAVDGAPGSAGPAEGTNGVNGTASEPPAPKESKVTNGVKEKDSAGSEEPKAPPKADETQASAEGKTASEEATKAPEAVEASA